MIIKKIVLFLFLSLLSSLFITPKRTYAACLIGCPPVGGRNACSSGICNSNEICSMNGCCTNCTSKPPSCQTSDQGCGANGCPPNTKRICINCGGGWSCSCNASASCGPACDPNAWGACSVGCGGGTQTNGCGGTRSCNTQPCCTPSCNSPFCGQGNGCGGTCSSSDNVWSAWSACSPVTYRRTRTNPCQATQTELCNGTITGHIFDATNYAICPGSFAGIGLNTVAVSAVSSTITYNTTTDSSGAYSITARSPSTYTVTAVPSALYVQTPKLTCQGNSVTFSGQGQSATLDFGYQIVYGGWWQVTNGSAYGGTGIQSIIPSTMPLASRYMILANANGADGLAYYKTGTLNLGNFPGQTVSVSGYNANSGYTGDIADYNYFKSKMSTFGQTAWNGQSQPTYNGGASNYEIYTYTGNVTLNWSPAAGQRVIYLIDGNVTVSGSITVPTIGGGFLAVFANGTITYNANVTDVAGWWVGNSLNFPCLDVAPANGVCDKTDVQFRGQGTFVGWNSISLSRDQYLTNNTQPAELFTYRPDLTINAPDPILVAKYIWRYQ